MMPDIWAIRHTIFKHFAMHAVAPKIEDITEFFGISKNQAQMALLKLDRLHAIFLDPGSFNIRIANPFSGIPTDFVVTVDEQKYWANCAWDSFGIIAALHAQNGDISAYCAENGADIRLSVRDGSAIDSGERVHFRVPFSEWYEDIVYT